MMTRPLGKTGFSIAPLVFGGNVFGWTIDEKPVLLFLMLSLTTVLTLSIRRMFPAGRRATGAANLKHNRPLATGAPGMRDKVKIFTKVGSDLGLPGHKGSAKPGSNRRLTTLCVA